jgi:fatty acid desaturase/membrane-associated phospholipid phosphatase
MRREAERVNSSPDALVKVSLLIGLGLLVAVPYFTIQRHPFFSATLIPLTPIDRALPFWEPAILLYLSLYFLLALPLLLARDRQNLCQMAFGFGWIAAISHSLFLVWPTAVPALASATQGTSPIIRLVLAADSNWNACPSLHASLAIYCALCSAHLLKNRKSKVAIWMWTLLVLASTLLAKRHVVLDLCMGAALGFAAYVALFRTRPDDSASSEALRATLRARADIARKLEPNFAPLTAHDWRKRAAEFACFGALGAFGFWLTVTSFHASRWFLVAIGIAATSLALNAFVLLMHDGMHDTLFRSRRWNRIGSVLLGSTFLMSFSAYRVLHSRHHKFLGDPRDPDDYHHYVRHPALVWSMHFVRLTIGSLLYLMAIPVLALKFGTDVQRRRILAEYAIMFAAYILLLRFVPESILLVAWFVPLLIVGSLTAIRGFTQHGITDATDPYIASRTILPHPVVGFLLLHENYHLEHHLFPEVPSYHLPRLHEMVWPQLPRAVSGRSYLRFLVKFLRATPRLDESPIGLERPAAKST